MITLEYYIAKIIGKIKRDQHKETLTKWFKKKGVKFSGGLCVY